MKALFERSLQFPDHRRHVVMSCAWLLLCLQIPLACAVDIADLQVSEAQGVYRINLVMQMQVPAHYVHGVLTDYRHIYRLDPAIVDSGILPSPGAGVVRVRTRISDCIAFFCMMIDRVEDVRELESGELQATIVPALSNFRYGHAEWKIVAHEGRTRVIYQAQLEPDFFIPPLIGSYFVKQKLRNSVLTSMARVECIARIQAGLEPDSVLEKLLAADQQAGNQAVDAALLAGEDPTLIARAPAAGEPAWEVTGCDRPCRVEDVSCQP
jgi:hypothetical protein